MFIVFNQLKSVFSSNPGKIVVVKGDGKQKLSVSQIQSSENNKTSGGKVRLFKGEKDVPAKEGEFIKDKKLNTVSYKKGNTTIYVIPVNYNTTPENNNFYKVY